MRRALAVVGLGYGDEGKGATVDYLSWKYKSEGVLVVRFNGGAQTAHNVVLPDGRHHTFSQFGSGSLNEAQTLLTKDVLVNPRAMIVEWMSLKDKLRFSSPTVYVSEECLVTTGFHIALNRVKLFAWGGNNSCGMGIGETRRLAEKLGKDALRVGDFENDYPRKKLKLLQEVCQEEALRILNTTVIPDDFELLSANEDHLNELLWMYRQWYFHMIKPVCDGDVVRQIKNTPVVIFEGAQGVLLDETHGEDGYNTWTNTTLENMDSLLKECELYASDCVLRLGVIRTYMTRHGDGPLKDEYAMGWPEPHNPDTGYCGKFRFAPLDFVKLRKAISLCPVDGLVVNHTDQRKGHVEEIETQLNKKVLLTGCGPTRRDRQDMLHKVEKGELVCGK